MELCGIILSGGKSSRMGMEKGLMQFENKPLIQYSLDLAKQFCKEIILVANSDDYQKFNARLISDLVENKGPLGGLYTGISYSAAKSFLLLPCDMPHLSSRVIDKIISNHKAEISIARQDNRNHPLIGIYEQSILAKIRSCLNSDNLAMMSMIEKCDHNIIEFDQSFAKDFKNYNSREDFKN